MKATLKRGPGTAHGSDHQERRDVGDSSGTMERWRVIEEPKCGVWTGNWGITGVIRLKTHGIC